MSETLVPLEFVHRRLLMNVAFEEARTKTAIVSTTLVVGDSGEGGVTTKVMSTSLPTRVFAGINT